jgi:1,6-anhydro-N-acetylmuramate kinase
MDHGERCDRDGHMGQQGKVNHDLLAKLFHTGVVTKDGENFLLVKPPKSSDPQWYKMIPELVDRGALPFADRLRTAEYFSAYIYFFGLTMIPQNIEVPCHYALCGGGWKNPVSRNHFAGLLKGDFANNPVLAEHKDLFATFLLRFGKKDVAANAVVDFSESYGFDGTAMEARIFADAAVCRIKGEAFTKPATTGVRQDTVTGIVRFPGKSQNNATANLLEWMSHFKSHDLTVDRPQVFDGRWSRACAGWHSKLSK